MTFALGELAVVAQRNPSNEEVARFWDKVEKCTVCWEWTAGKSTAGYGSFSSKLERSAHRFSYMLHNGPIPAGKHILHRCDNPGFVRPDHLELGDHDKNMADAAARNRMARGAKHYRSKLSTQQVLDIVEIRNAGGRIKDVCQVFDVTYGAVVSIMKGESWSHVTGIPQCVKQRLRPGEKRKPPKLSSGRVKKIRALLRDGRTQEEIAREFEVSTATISAVNTNKGWVLAIQNQVSHTN